MTSEKVIVTRICDCCKKKVDKFADNERFPSQKLNITIDVNGSGWSAEHGMDLCQECNDELIEFMRKKGNHVGTAALGYRKEKL